MIDLGCYLIITIFVTGMIVYFALRCIDWIVNGNYPIESEGDCPVCENPIIKKKTDGHIKYFCTHCDWRVDYIYNNGVWRRGDI